MSITNQQNDDGKLISLVDVNSERFSHKSSRCSCSDCDLKSCFVKRNTDQCKCTDCKDKHNCLPLTKKASQENEAGDLRDIATKKIIREVVTRETIESLKKVTETLYGFDNSENLEMIAAKMSTLSNKKPVPQSSETCDRNIRENKDSIKNANGKECCKQRPSIKIPSIDVTNTQKEVATQAKNTVTKAGDTATKGDNTATKLSAQVMNVPYEDLHESVPSKQVSDYIPISKLNIFKRIKEIYDACSCKVCECISSKPIDIQNELCKCKPCDCNDCAAIRRKIEMTVTEVPPHSGCPCVRCDRKDCRGVVKNASQVQSCDCKPCDHMQCTQNIPKSCDCEPCQCIKCKSSNVRSSKTVTLAQTDEVIQREVCHCSPCECIECKQIYNRTIPTVMCTTSTEMARHHNCRCENCPVERCQYGEIETCTCERRNRSVRKPFENNYNDYDIRTVIVDNNSPFNRQNKNAFQKQNTIALFASLENNYSYNSRNTSLCKCNDCECLVCPDRDETLRCRRQNLLQPNIQLLQNTNLPTSFRNACKCTLCECDICSKRQRENSIPTHNKCKCDICDCVNCDHVPTCGTSTRKTSKAKNNLNKNNNCSCNPCECINCRKLLSCTSQSSVKFYSDRKFVERKVARCLRKVSLLSPSTSDYDNLEKPLVRRVSSITLSPKKSMEGIYRQDIATRHSPLEDDNVPINHSTYPGHDQLFNLYENNNIHSRRSLKRNVLFNLNDQSLQPVSRTSIADEQIVKKYKELNQMTLKALKIAGKARSKLSKPEYKNFSIIHETPTKMDSNDSDESVPVFWTCHNEMSYSNSFSRNFNINSNIPESRSKDEVNKCNTFSESKYGTASCSRGESKRKDLHEISENHNYQITADIAETFVGDSYIESLKRPYERNYDYIFSNEHDVLCLESYKYNDPFKNALKNNYKKIKLSHDVNHSNLTITYERATKVLKEAKAFSSKLITMLDSFDKANKEFISESQKLKKLHNSLLNMNKEVFNGYNINITKQSRPYEKTTQNRDENEAEKEYEHSTNKLMDNNCMQCNQDLRLNDGALDMKCLNATIVQTNNITDNKSKYTEYFVPKEPYPVQNHENIEPNNILLKKSKTSHRLTSKSMNLSTNLSNQASSTKRIENTNITNKNLNVTNEHANITNEHTHARLSTVMKKLDSVFGNTTSVDSAVITEDIEKKLVCNLEQGDKKPWTVFRKNLFLNATPIKNRRVVGYPNVELDIKEAIQAIKLEAAKDNNSHRAISKPNEALTNLQIEVNSLLNMPILQSNSQCKEKPVVVDTNRSEYKGKNDMIVKSISSTVSSQTHNLMVTKADKEVYFNSNQMVRQTQESSREANRVSITGLRRISDHTVLVKWKVPKNLEGIEGYEVLVDGRAAHRCGVTRRAAVLTCLPGAPRVLLAVRAVGPRAPPAHTVLYRPRR